MDHDALARSLADSLRTEHRMVWCDIQLGPAGSPRPDVYTIFKSFVQAHPTAYEVKVSRADFMHDVTSGKWQEYLKFAGAVFFACEAGLFSPKELPARCGLMVHTGKSWRTVKRAIREPVIIPQQAVLKLLIDGVEREGPRARAKHFRSDADFYTKITTKHGEAVAAAVKDRFAVERESKFMMERVERTKEQIEATRENMMAEFNRITAPLRDELCEMLGLKEGESSWNIKMAVQKLRAQMAHNPAQVKLDNIAAILRS